MVDIYDPEWLKRRIVESKLKPSELAAISGVSKSQIERIRAGMEPRLSTLRKLVVALESAA